MISGKGILSSFRHSWQILIIDEDFSTFLVIFYSSENVVGLSQLDAQLTPAWGGEWAEQAQQPPDAVHYFLFSGLFHPSQRTR